MCAEEKTKKRKESQIYRNIRKMRKRPLPRFLRAEPLIIIVPSAPIPLLLLLLCSIGYRRVRARAPAVLYHLFIFGSATTTPFGRPRDCGHFFHQVRNLLVQHVDLHLVEPVALLLLRAHLVLCVKVLGLQLGDLQRDGKLVS